jgi:MoaA/NifB/PqqE/SkfB family radical SAM enzyme
MVAAGEEGVHRPRLSRFFRRIHAGLVGMAAGSSPQASVMPVPPRPDSLQVEITSSCNLTCTMCPLTLGATLSSARPGHITDATWRQVLDAATEIGRVNLTGYGENTTNPKFVAMLRALDEREVKTSFTTNGIGVRDVLVAELAKMRHLECINVSIDSPDPEVYRRIRGGDVQRALRGLARISRALRPRVTVTVSSVVMAANVESLAWFPDVLKAIGVDAYVLQGLHDRADVMGDLDVRRHADLMPVLRAVHARGRELGLEVQLQAGDLGTFDPIAEVEPESIEFSATRTRQCMSPWLVPFVDRSGRVFPCCHGDGRAIMGELGAASLRDVWNGEAFRKFRADLLGGSALPAICRTCTAVRRLGPHQLRFAGAVESLAREPGARPRIRLRVRNTGIETWTRDWPLAIGKVGDDASRFWLDTWAAHNRIRYMAEPEVKPGQHATFEFEIGAVERAAPETFSALVEGVTWLPDTRFDLPVRTR